MRHSAKKSTCDTQLFSRSHPRTPRGGWCEHWRALWGSFGAVSVGYAPTPFHVNPREGKGVKGGYGDFEKLQPCKSDYTTSQNTYQTCPKRPR